MIVGKVLNKFINVFTGVFGIAALICMLVIYINNVAGGTVLPIEAALSLGTARNYLMLATVFCAGAEFTLKRNLILAIIFAAIVVGVAVFMVYTDVAM